MQVRIRAADRLVFAARNLQGPDWTSARLLSERSRVRIPPGLPPRTIPRYRLRCAYRARRLCRSATERSGLQQAPSVLVPDGAVRNRDRLRVVDVNLVAFFTACRTASRRPPPECPSSRRRPLVRRCGRLRNRRERALSRARTFGLHRRRVTSLCRGSSCWAPKRLRPAAGGARARETCREVPSLKPVQA